MRIPLLFVMIGLMLAPLCAEASVLHDAARKGDAAAIAEALGNGANINERDGLATPLYYAVRLGHYAAAKLLIERGADVNAPTDYWGDPLMMAVKIGRVDLMELLLANGASPETTHKGEFAVHVAAKFGCLACVKALVKAGADVNAMTFEIKDHIKDQTPLHLAKFYGFPAIASYLEEHGATIPKPPPINSKLANADAQLGQVYFAENCGYCHLAEPGKGRKQAPNLWDVVGRSKASLKEARYSKALQNWGGAWTYEDLNTFLYGPMLTVPGSSMQTVGIPDQFLRADLIAYLRTLSDTPAPLP